MPCQPRRPVTQQWHNTRPGLNGCAWKNPGIQGAYVRFRTTQGNPFLRLGDMPIVPVPIRTKWRD